MDINEQTTIKTIPLNSKQGSLILRFMAFGFIVIGIISSLITLGAGIALKNSTEYAAKNYTAITTGTVQPGAYTDSERNCTGSGSCRNYYDCHYSYGYSPNGDGLILGEASEDGKCSPNLEGSSVTVYYNPNAPEESTTSNPNDPLIQNVWKITIGLGIGIPVVLVLVGVAIARKSKKIQEGLVGDGMGDGEDPRGYFVDSNRIIKQ